MKSGSTLDARTRRAEREGFEPSIRVSAYAGLANRCLQPLGHLSGRVSEVIGAEIVLQPWMLAELCAGVHQFWNARLGDKTVAMYTRSLTTLLPALGLIAVVASPLAV